MLIGNGITQGSLRVLGTLYADTIKGLANYNVSLSFSTASIVKTDSFDIAFSKLLKLINSIITIVGGENADSDNKINLLREVYTFLNNVVESDNALTKFVTVDTTQNISGTKTFTSNVILGNALSGDSPHLIFRRVKEGDTLFDWDLYVTGGDLKFRYNTTDGWHDIFKLTSNAATLNTPLSVLGVVNITSSEGIRLHAVDKTSSIWFNCVNNSNYDANSFGITQDSAGLRFRYGTSTSPTDRVKILNNGNLGVGTSLPADKFHVNGTLRQSNSISGTYTLTTDNTTKTISGDKCLRIYQTGGNGSGTTALDAATVSNLASYCDYVTDSDYHRFNKHLITNGALTVSGVSTLKGEVRIGSTTAGPNFISFYGTSGDEPGNYNHTFIGERIWGSSERSELLLFKGNDPGANASSEGSGPDRIRHVAGAHLFLIYKLTLLGSFSNIGASTVPVNVLEVRQSGILVTGSITKSGGTSALFLKADGSVDSNTYLTSHQSLSNLVTLNSAQTIAAKKTFNVQQAFAATLGTAPFTVVSNTVVSSLNADLLDGFHASAFVKLTTSRFTLHNLGAWVKILEFTTSTANNIGACISFTWHPTECARSIWADFQFEVRQRSASTFKALWKGGYTRNLKAVSDDGDTWSIWVEGSKSSYDPYGMILVTSMWSIKSYSQTVSYLDAVPTGQYSITCSTETLPHNAASASKLTTTSKTAWGLTYWTTNGIPTSISGAISSTGNITPQTTKAFDIGTNALSYRYGYFTWLGSAAGTALNIAANNLNSHISINTSGNVGIGTTSPTAKLDVNGIINSNNQIQAIKYKCLNKTFTGVKGTANDANNANLYFGTFRPNDFLDSWHISYRINAKVTDSSITNYNNSRGEFKVEIWGNRSSYTYALMNEHYSTSYRVLYRHIFYRLKQAGYNANYGYILGIGLYQAWNPTYARQFEIEILQLDNCTFTFFNEFTKLPDYCNTTNYESVINFNGDTNGFFKTRDVNDVTTLYNQYTNLQAGTNGIKLYSLVMQDSDGKWQSFTTTSGTGTDKPVNGNTGFRLGNIYYMATSNNYTNNAYIGNTICITFVNLINLLYSLNISQTQLVAKKPLYIVGTVRANGLFYLDSTWWTQDEPTAQNNKVYIFIGYIYDDGSSKAYRCDFQGWKGAYMFINGGFKQVTTQEILDVIRKTLYPNTSDTIIDLGYSTIYKELSSSSTLSFTGTMSNGLETHVIIKNTKTSSITITIPTNSSYICTSEENTLDIDAGKFGEINIVKINNIYFCRMA